MAERGLTAGEIALAKSVFGNAIDYDRVTIYSSDVTPIKQGGAMSVGGDLLFIESSLYHGDFSRSEGWQRGLFIHEMTHVWQAQSGRNVFVEGFVLQFVNLFPGVKVYNYGTIDSSTKFENLNLEQQAALVENMYLGLINEEPNHKNIKYDPNLLKSLLPFSEKSGQLPVSNKVKVPLPPPRPTEFGGIAQCFLAGTPIALPGGETVAIESVEVGQDVLAFDATTDGAASPLVARKVVRLFENVTQQIVDFHGLKCTPGHAFLSVDPDHPGETRFATIASILKEDGIVVRRDGTQIRARTNQRIGTIEDVVVRIVYRDPIHQAENHVYARAGMPAPCTIRDEVSGEPKTVLVSLSRLILGLGYELGVDGHLEGPGGERFDAIDWPADSRPYDTAEAQNWIVADQDGRAIRPHWIDALPDSDRKPNLARRASA